MNQSKCRACGKELKFIQTAKGKSMPVDAETCSDDDAIWDPAKHVSHFVTCPSADVFRKRRNSQ
jgi:hypothetical protein